MKKLPKTGAQARRRKTIGGGQKNEFAVVLFMRAGDSHEAIRHLLSTPRALRAPAGIGKRALAVYRRTNAPVFRVQESAFGGLTSGLWTPASRESRPAEGKFKNRFRNRLAGTPGHGFLPVEMFGSDQAGDFIGIRRMRNNALGAGLGARTLTENATRPGCANREKRLTAGRAAA